MKHIVLQLQGSRHGRPVESDSAFKDCDDTVRWLCNGGKLDHGNRLYKYAPAQAMTADHKALLLVYAPFFSNTKANMSAGAARV